jgi:hypothetical protein
LICCPAGKAINHSAHQATLQIVRCHDYNRILSTSSCVRCSFVLLSFHLRMARDKVSCPSSDDLRQLAA